MNARGTVLLIDDDPDICRSVVRLLSSYGFDVRTHDRGFNSTNLIDQLRPVLVLLDVNMPFLSGDHLAEVIRQYPHLDQIPIVFFSSNDEASLRDLANTHKVAGYIPKSAMGSNFVERVVRFVARGQRSRA